MNVIGVVPVHLPSIAVSVAPSSAVPEIDGSAVLTGAAGSTAAVAALVADTVPAMLAAVTTTRIVAPTSAPVSV